RKEKIFRPHRAEVARRVVRFAVDEQPPGGGGGRFFPFLYDDGARARRAFDGDRSPAAAGKQRLLLPGSEPAARRFRIGRSRIGSRSRWRWRDPSRQANAHQRNADPIPRSRRVFAWQKSFGNRVSRRGAPRDRKFGTGFGHPCQRRIPPRGLRGAGPARAHASGSTRSGAGKRKTAMSRRRIRLTINGREYAGEVEARKLLTDFLRDDLGLTGTHVGCEHGVCGACTVLLNGEPVRSCLLFAVQANGAALKTVEGLAPNATELHPLQEKFWELHGLQCGFCTPG